jgi:DNA-binding transcriptional LysR family regulator
VKPALDQLAGSHNIVADGNKAKDRARISVSGAAMELLIAPILPAFRADHSGFTLEIVVEDRIVDPVAGRFDAVIRRGSLLEKDMIARRLSKDDRLVLVASGSYLAQQNPFTHPRDVGRDRILIRRPRSSAALPWLLTRTLETVRVDADAILIVDSAIAARQFAMAGLGVALLAYEFVAAQLKAGLLCVVMPEWQQPVEGFHIMYVHRGHLSPPLWELERAIRQKANGSG